MSSRFARAAGGGVAVLALATATAARVAAQVDSVSVIAGPHFSAGPLRQRLLGERYRTLWTAPIRVPVLDLSTFAGGLTRLARAADEADGVLYLAGTDGRTYSFRPIPHRPPAAAGAGSDGTLLDRILRDQDKSLHPAAALIAAPLLRTAGIPQPEPRLVFLPTASGWTGPGGEPGGGLGVLEERSGQPGESGPHGPELTDTPELMKLLDTSPLQRVDSRAYLRERLLDVLLGDLHRNAHAPLWTRAGGEGAGWVPVPHDRDHALVDYDGLLLRTARWLFPQRVRFDGGYGNLSGVTLTAQALDRRLLAELAWTTWDSVTTSLQASLTDPVIEGAVQRMPPEYQVRDGPRLAGVLRARRDLLGEAARRFYRELAVTTDVHASDVAEVAEVERLGDQGLEVRLFTRRADQGGTGGAPYFRRRFSPDETREVRLYMHGGDDLVRVTGSAPGPMVRVIGGAGTDSIESSGRHTDPGGRITVHDSPDDGRLAAGGSAEPGTPLHQPPQTPPTRSGIAPRDWGTSLSLRPTLDYSSSFGITAGAALSYTRYGFRQSPYVYRLVLRSAYATGAKGFELDLAGDYRLSSRVSATLEARASQIEAIYYNGLGNETVEEEWEDHVVFEEQVRLHPALRVPLSSTAWISLGPAVKYTRPELKRGSRIERERPYGSGTFAQLGAEFRLNLDSFDQPTLPRRGIRVTASASGYPAAWDAAEAFGRAGVSSRALITLPIVARPTVVLRAGGEKVVGRYPVHEAAFLGGSETLRGHVYRRFAGDATLYGSVGVRTSLVEIRHPAPAILGSYVVEDFGRVYLEGESSRRWHTATGAGLWYLVHLGERTYSASLIYTRGESRQLYLGMGLPF